MNSAGKRSSLPSRSRPKTTVLSPNKTSLSPLQPVTQLLRAWSNERLSITASLKQMTSSPLRSLTPQNCTLDEADPSSPRTPIRRQVLGERFTYSEARPKSSMEDTPKAVDLLTNQGLQAKRKGKKSLSPFRDQVSMDPSLFPYSQIEKELVSAETETNQTVSTITVRLLSQLSNVTLPSLQLEKTLFALLILCAEVDSSVEVGFNCKVMASRSWSAVRRYLQSPGQVVQTIRKLIPCIQKGKISRGAVIRTSEMLTDIAEEKMKTERGGDVGIAVFRLMKTVVFYYQTWEKITDQKEKERISRRKEDRKSGGREEIRMRKSTSRSSVRPKSPFQEVERSGISLACPDSPLFRAETDPPFTSESLFPKPTHELDLFPPGSPQTPFLPNQRILPLHPPMEDTSIPPSFQQVKTNLEQRRKQSIVEMTLNWELENQFRQFLLNKVNKKDGKVDREQVLSEFKVAIATNPSINRAFEGAETDFAHSIVTHYLTSLGHGSLYEKELQRALKLFHLETHMQEVGKAYNALAKERERLERVVSHMKASR